MIANEEILARIANKDFDDLDDEELEALDREIAKTPEGRALIRRIMLPQGNWTLYR